MIISTFCQECDVDLLDIEGEYQQESNYMTYTCTKCGHEQEQQGWEEKK
jgi:RNase P subunit RPR2